MVFTHRARVYAATISQMHDLSFNWDRTDVEGEDIKCRIFPSQSELLELPARGEFGMVKRPVTVWFEPGVDIREGYTVRIHRTRVVDGAREKISVTVMNDASVGDTTIDVYSVLGVLPGDQMLVSSSSELISIKSIDSNELTLYYELKNAISEDDTLTECRYYQVVSVYTPHGGGPFIEADVVETMTEGF